MIRNGKNYIITTDGWFVASDGEQYKSVYGKCEIKTTEDVFDFKPSRPSTNWFVLVTGTDSSLEDSVSEMIVAGCQIHYALQVEERPLRKPNFTKGEPDNRIFFV